jgi:hypothetical protein
MTELTKILQKSSENIVLEFPIFLKNKISFIDKQVKTNFPNFDKIKLYLTKIYQNIAQENFCLKKINLWNVEFGCYLSVLIKNEELNLTKKIIEIILDIFKYIFPTSFSKIIKIFVPIFELLKKDDKIKEIIFEDIYIFLQKLYFYFNSKDQKKMNKLIIQKFDFLNKRNNIFSCVERFEEKNNCQYLTDNIFDNEDNLKKNENVIKTSSKIKRDKENKKIKIKKRSTLFKSICERYNEKSSLSDLTKIYPFCLFIKSSLKKNYFSTLTKLYLKNLEKENLFRKKVEREKKSLSAFNSPTKKINIRKVTTPIKCKLQKDHSKISEFIFKKVSFHENKNCFKDFDKNETVSNF